MLPMHHLKLIIAAFAIFIVFLSATAIYRNSSGDGNIIYSATISGTRSLQSLSHSVCTTISGKKRCISTEKDRYVIGIDSKLVVNWQFNDGAQTRIVVVSKGSKPSNRNAWIMQRRTCTAQNTDLKCTGQTVTNGMVEFDTSNRTDVEQYDVYLTTNDYTIRAGPLTISMVKFEPPVPPPVAMPSSNTNPTSTSLTQCNINVPDNCIEIVKSTFVLDIDDSIEVTWTDSPRDDFQIVFVREGHDVNNSLWNKTLGSPNGSLNIPLVVNGFQEPGNFEIYLASNLLVKKTMPLEVSIVSQTRPPTNPTKQPTRPATKAPTVSETRPPTNPTKQPTRPATKPPTIEICGDEADHWEAMEGFKDFHSTTLELSNGLKRFLSDSATLPVYTEPLNNNERHLQVGGIFTGLRLLTDGLDGINEKGPLSIATSVLGVASFIADFFGGDVSNDQILEALDGIKGQINDLSNQLENGINYIINTLLINDKMTGIIEQKTKLMNMAKGYRDLVETIQDKDSYQRIDTWKANLASRNQFFGIQCYADNLSPFFVFRDLFSTVCCYNEENNCFFRGETLTCGNHLDTFVKKYEDSYKDTDAHDFRYRFGIVILSGMIDAMYMHLLCIKNEHPNWCKPNDITWVRDFEAMRDAIKVASANIHKAATTLVGCTKKSVRIYRFDPGCLKRRCLGTRCTGDVGCWLNLDNGDPNEIQIHLNNQLYMPKNSADCMRGMCHKMKYCDYNTGGWDKNSCYVEQLNKDSYLSSPSVSPKSFPEPEQLRFHMVELDPGSDDKLELFTFPGNHWHPFSIHHQCDTTHPQLSNQINGKQYVATMTLEVKPVFRACAEMCDENIRGNIACRSGTQTEQSSTWNGAVSSRAVDGCLNGIDAGNRSMSHTNSQMSPWWKVILVQNFIIDTIRIYSRVDGWTDRLKGMVVEILNARGAPVWKTDPYQGIPGYETIFEVPRIKGRSVRVSLPGKTEHLSLTEVEVLGIAPGTASWMQVGTDVMGRKQRDYFGYSISVSGNGRIVAVGAPGNQGYVQVYHYHSSEWTTVGDILGGTTTDGFGEAISLNENGDIIAIGIPYNNDNGQQTGKVEIYQYDGSAWSRRGLDIVGTTVGGRCGKSVSLSHDGSSIAISCLSFNGETRMVRVFKWNGQAWVQQGADIVGSISMYRFGYSISMNREGDKIAVGVPAYQDSESPEYGQGCALVYVWKNNSWVQQGNFIQGLGGREFGGAVSLSSDGTTIAVGSHRSISGGFVQVYSWENNSWVQAGQTVNGDQAGDWFGWSVSMNSDGTKFVAGAMFTNGIPSGYAHIYNLVGTSLVDSSWVKEDNGLDGADGYRFGASVSISLDGDVVAVGGTGYNNFRGTAKIFATP